MLVQQPRSKFVRSVSPIRHASFGVGFLILGEIYPNSQSMSRLKGMGQPLVGEWRCKVGNLEVLGPLVRDVVGR